MLDFFRVPSPLNSVATDARLILRCGAKRVRASSRRLLRVVLASLLFAGCQSKAERSSVFSTKEPVGQIGTNRYYTPANQILTPVGKQVELPGMRPQALAL